VPEVVDFWRDGFQEHLLPQSWVEVPIVLAGQYMYAADIRTYLFSTGTRSIMYFILKDK
jgi:hypothetical protein